MKFINLTPHVLNVHHVDGTIEVVPPSGNLARCEEIVISEYAIDGVQFQRLKFGNITGLPECAFDNTIYIVSMVVIQALDELEDRRLDVWSPGKPVRNAEGQIIGCEGLRRAV